MASAAFGYHFMKCSTPSVKQLPPKKTFRPACSRIQRPSMAPMGSCSEKIIDTPSTCGCDSRTRSTSTFSR